MGHLFSADTWKLLLGSGGILGIIATYILGPTVQEWFKRRSAEKDAARVRLLEQEKQKNEEDRLRDEGRDKDVQERREELREREARVQAAQDAVVAALHERVADAERRAKAATEQCDSEQVRSQKSREAELSALDTVRALRIDILNLQRELAEVQIKELSAQALVARHAQEITELQARLAMVNRELNGVK